jgi:hypothetical protein
LQLGGAAAAKALNGWQAIATASRRLRAPAAACMCALARRHHCTFHPRPCTVLMSFTRVCVWCRSTPLNGTLYAPLGSPPTYLLGGRVIPQQEPGLTTAETKASALTVTAGLPGECDPCGSRMCGWLAPCVRYSNFSAPGCCGCAATLPSFCRSSRRRPAQPGS